jgi:uncharacterized membrane protein HdeD (DUF308 family)
MTMLQMAATVEMARWWWAFILRGVIAIAFGVIALVLPGLGLLTLVALFGFWALLEGVTSFLDGLRSRARNKNWWVEVLEGVVSIAAGVLALLFPAFAAEILLILIAAWAVLIGVFQIYMAIRLRDEIRGEFWLGLAGVAAIMFGISIHLRDLDAPLPVGRRPQPRLADSRRGDRLRRLPRDPRLAPATHQRAREAGRSDRLQPRLTQLSHRGVGPAARAS